MYKDTRHMMKISEKLYQLCKHSLPPKEFIALFFKITSRTKVELEKL